MEIKELLSPATRELQTTIHPSSLITPDAERHDWRFDVRTDYAAEREKLRAMLTAAKCFASAMQRDQTPYVLSLLGTSETGKTLLGKDVTRFFREVARWYRETVYNTGALLVRPGGRVEWRKVISEARSGNFAIVDDLETDWFVCLDDVGAEHDSAFAKSILDRVLNARCGRRWTMLTSNLTLAQLAEWDVRIASRLERDGGVSICTKGIRQWTARHRKAA